MAVKRMSRKNASKRSEKKSTKRSESKGKKTMKADMGTALCPNCKKVVKVVDGKVGEFKRRGGKTGKMLRGTGDCGHKVFRIMPNNA